jgi:hypothetical protein
MLSSFYWIKIWNAHLVGLFLLFGSCVRFQRNHCLLLHSLDIACFFKFLKISKHWNYPLELCLKSFIWGLRFKTLQRNNLCASVSNEFIYNSCKCKAVLGPFSFWFLVQFSNWKPPCIAWVRIKLKIDPQVLPKVRTIFNDLKKNLRLGSHMG